MDGKTLFVSPQEIYADLGSSRAEPRVLALFASAGSLATRGPMSRAITNGRCNKDRNLRRRAMNQKLMWTIGAGGVLLVGATALVMTMAEPTRGRVLIAGDKPVTEDQVRQKLQSE